MATNSRIVKAPPDKIWAVLEDGWLYPLWVVGASRMREVDDDWPAVGSRLHHSVGSWPLLIDDTTESLEVVPDTQLRLRARGWPGGEAEVLVTLEPHPEGTRVVIEEDAVRGPGVLVPRPVRSPLIGWRNVETLRRLALLAERR
ncbi:SRPBCC family protein [Nocardioides dongxiaopingii]|uniref:SRPBCC family protein n=1 Tax=Nocardioides sp. S-1144 TaxID=2582905 RepID=UPI00110ED5A2|nr:SRPBCC family protein [Nocardioides sp. S-1144]QCW51571.1 SRPBCC family protein [Nocardioides sp. S-1144]